MAELNRSNGAWWRFEPANPRLRMALLLGVVVMGAPGWVGATEAIDAGTTAASTPFTEVSAEACSACHGPGGTGPQVDLNQVPCSGCHDGGHGEEGGVSTRTNPARSAPDHGTAPARIIDLSQVNLSDMVRIPAGPAIVGNHGREITEGKGNLDETPEHRVTLQAFYIDRYEVSNARYRRFTDATEHRLPRHWKQDTIPAGKEHHPVVYVSWDDAHDYCAWQGKRLPDEMEWEKAARGTDGQVFPWGNRFALDRANTPQRWASMKDKGGTMPVGSFESGKSPYGLYDMAGNVWEWTASWYLPYPGNSFPNSFYGHKNRVLRGGSWYDCLSYGCGLSAPTFNRSRFSPRIRNNSFGFRCAVSDPAAQVASLPSTPALESAPTAVGAPP